MAEREYRYDDEKSTESTKVIKDDNAVQNGETKLVVAGASGSEIIYHEPPCPVADAVRPRVVDERFEPCGHCCSDGEDVGYAPESDGDTGLSTDVWNEDEQ